MTDRERDVATAGPPAGRPAQPGIRRALRSRAAWRVAVAVLVLIALVVGVQSFRAAARPQGNDFTSYLASAHALVEGSDPYGTGSRFAYVYPLFLALLLVPFTWVPQPLAVVLWYAIQLGSLVLAVALLLSVAGPRLGLSRPRDAVVPLAVPALLMLSTIQNHQRNGQVDLPVLAICTLFLALVRTRPGWAALALGAAIALKLVPAILILMLLVDRRPVAALLAALWGAVLVLLPGLIAGLELFDHYHGYADGFLVPRLGERSGHLGLDFTLAGCLAALLDRPAGPLTRIVSTAAVLGAIVGAQIGLARRQADREGWIFALYLLGTLMLVPISQLHHVVFAFPAVVLLTMQVVLPAPAPAGRHADRWSLPSALAGFFASYLLAAELRSGPLFLAAFVLLFLGVCRGMVTATPEGTDPDRSATPGAARRWSRRP